MNIFGPRSAACREYEARNREKKLQSNILQFFPLGKNMQSNLAINVLAIQTT